MAYFYSKRPENKFYILNQDYSYGHIMATAFREALKQYKPGAEVVGEDFHPLFIKDFAPYITKIQASGAEVIFTGDWSPDAQNLLVQSRQMGCNLPFRKYLHGCTGNSLCCRVAKVQGAWLISTIIT